MDQRVGLIILGLLGAIAFDGFYATVSGHPWRLRPDVEVISVSVQTDAADERLLLEALQDNDGHNIKVLWTKCSPASETIGWKIEAGGFLTPVAPTGCPTQNRGLADQIVVQ